MSVGLHPLGTQPLGLTSVASGGATDTPVSPGAGSLAITGYAPAITQTANQSVAPSAGALTLTGYAPSIARTANQGVTPSAGALTITGYAPTVTQAAGSQSISPGVGQLVITGYAPSVTQVDPSAPAGGGHGFEMVSMEPSWRRALRLRAEAKQLTLDRKKRKRAEFLEKLAAKEVLSPKTDTQIESRIDSLLAEWVDLAPKLELTPVAEVPPDDAYHAFMARVAEQIRRLEDEDDEHAAEMLLLT